MQAQVSQICHTWLLPKSARNDNQGSTLPSNPFRIAELKETPSRVGVLSESNQPSICSVLRCQLLTTQSQFWPGGKRDISGKNAKINIPTKEASCHSRNCVPMLVHKWHRLSTSQSILHTNICMYTIAVSFWWAFLSKQVYYWKNRDLGWDEMGKGEASPWACYVFITSISCSVPS